MAQVGWRSIEEMFEEDAPDGIWDRDRLDRALYYECQAMTDGRRWGRRPKTYEEDRDDTRHP